MHAPPSSPISRAFTFHQPPNLLPSLLTDSKKRCPPPLQLEGRTELLQELLGGMDTSDPPFIEPPFVCDYGGNIYMGAGSYMNFGCTVLDACK